MRVIFGCFSLWGRSIESESALRSLLDHQFQDRNVLIKGDYAECFELLELRRLGVSDSHFAIGVIRDMACLPVTVTALNSNSSLAVGCNCCVTRLSAPEGRTEFQTDLDPGMLVHDLVSLNENALLAVCEIGICVLDEKGHIVWTFSRDVVTGYELAAEYLTLYHLDTHPWRVELVNGVATEAAG